MLVAMFFQYDSRGVAAPLAIGFSHPDLLGQIMQLLQLTAAAIATSGFSERGLDLVNPFSGSTSGFSVRQATV